MSVTLATIQSADENGSYDPWNETIKIVTVI